MAEMIASHDLHRVVITAIIFNNNGRFLITKRSPGMKVFPNKWEVPGGGLEKGDYEHIKKTNDDAWYFVVERTLRREVMEEVGLEIEKPHYLLDLIFIRPDKVPVLTLSYYAKLKSGEVKLAEREVVDYKWITPDEGRDYDLISGIQREIEMVDEILKGKTNSVFRS